MFGWVATRGRVRLLPNREIAVGCGSAGASPSHPIVNTLQLPVAQAQAASAAELSAVLPLEQFAVALDELHFVDRLQQQRAGGEACRRIRNLFSRLDVKAIQTLSGVGPHFEPILRHRLATLFANPVGTV